MITSVGAVLAGCAEHHQRRPYLGTRNNASNDSMSNEMSITTSLFFARPITPGNGRQLSVMKDAMAHRTYVWNCQHAS